MGGTNSTNRKPEPYCRLEIHVNYDGRTDQRLQKTYCSVIIDENVSNSTTMELQGNGVYVVEFNYNMTIPLVPMTIQIWDAAKGQVKGIAKITKWWPSTQNPEGETCINSYPSDMLSSGVRIGDMDVIAKHNSVQETTGTSFMCCQKQSSNNVSNDSEIQTDQTDRKVSQLANIKIQNEAQQQGISGIGEELVTFGNIF